MEQESLDSRFDRMYQIENDQQSSHSSDVMSPTDTTGKSQGVFSAEDVAILQRLFQNMINGSPISKPKISATLAGDSNGKYMLEKCTLAQIVNRLKYERKQNRKKQTLKTLKIKFKKQSR